MPVSHMDLSWITVSDLDKAVEFYTKTVGLKVHQSSPEFGWVELKGENGGATLGLAQSNDAELMPPGAGAIVTMTVDDIESAKAKMAEQGATMQGEIMEVPGHVRLQVFTDSDGNKMQLVEVLS